MSVYACYSTSSVMESNEDQIIIAPADDHPVAIVGFSYGLFSPTSGTWLGNSRVGEDLFAVNIRRGKTALPSVYVGPYSGAKLNPNDADSSFQWYEGRTIAASETGSVRLLSFGFNCRLGCTFFFPPSIRLMASQPDTYLTVGTKSWMYGGYASPTEPLFFTTYVEEF